MSEPEIFIIGDYRSPTGPAKVTRAYIDGLKRRGEHFRYLSSQKKAARFFELLAKLPGSGLTFFSGYSRQNLLGMSLSKRLKKPCVYLMHGSVEYENEINKVPDPYMARCEYRMLEKADLVLAVSQWFEGWLKERYPEFKAKIGHLSNGVDWESLGNKARAEKDPPDTAIISIGGGMPRKRIARICEAIERINRERREKLTLTVIGDAGADSERIAQYPFVRNLGMVESSRIPEILGQHRLYIQNSVFETFGLSVLEALSCGNDILISKRCGCLEALGGLEEGDLIADPDDPKELAEKILGALKEHNNPRITAATDRNLSGWDRAVEELLKICGKTVRGQR